MSDMTIGDYAAAATIDGSTHYLLIQPGSASTPYKKINRNVFLGVTGQPVDISSTQTLSGKVLDNSNTATFKDTLFTLQDNSDTTKQAKFELSGITTATTRTYTLPNASSTIADISTAQTLTNKTLTAPVINNGSITGTTITTDAIIGQSASTSGTVYGLSISSGKVGSNGVVAASITDSAVAPAKLLTGTGSTWVAATFAPAATGYSGTPTTAVATYVQIGKKVILDMLISGTSNATTLTFTLPVTPKVGLAYMIYVTDNGSLQTSPGLLQMSAGSTTATCYKTMALGAFTGSGTKVLNVSGLIYEAQ